MKIFLKEDWFGIGILVIVASIVSFGFFAKNIANQKEDVEKGQVGTAALGDSQITKAPIEVEIFSTPNSGKYGDLKFWTKRIYNIDGTHDYDISFPQFIGGKEFININAYLESNLNEALEWRKSNLWAEGEDRSKPKKFNLNIQYRIASVVDDIISIDFVLDDYVDGGDGNNHQPIVINWDLKGDRLLKTDDIFCIKDYRTKIAEVIQSSAYHFAFSDLKEEDQEKIPGIIKNRIHAHVEELNEVLIGYKGVTFILPPYTIADGYLGIIRIPIPYSSLKGVVCLP